MTIKILDPVGVVETVQSGSAQVLASLAGKRLGCIFNQHVSSLDFWRAMEAEVDAKLKPASVHRVYKANTWASAPKADVERMIRETDYALVGVGA